MLDYCTYTLDITYKIACTYAPDITYTNSPDITHKNAPDMTYKIVRPLCSPNKRRAFNSYRIS